MGPTRAQGVFARHFSERRPESTGGRTLPDNKEGLLYVVIVGKGNVTWGRDMAWIWMLYRAFGLFLLSLILCRILNRMPGVSFNEAPSRLSYNGMDMSPIE